MGPGPWMIIIGIVIGAIAFVGALLNFQRGFVNSDSITKDVENTKKGFGKHLVLMGFMTGGGVIALIGVVLTIVSYLPSV